MRARYDVLVPQLPEKPLAEIPGPPANVAP
jgi:hypothetical protein